MSERRWAIQPWVGRAMMRYGLAIGLVAIAVLLRGAVPQVLAETPYLVFFPAVLASAAFLGMGPGLLATVLSALSVHLLFPEPHWRLGVDDPVQATRVMIFAATGIGISLVAGMRRQAQATERQHTEALRRSELFHRQTLESIPGMVFTTRPDGFCDYQSQQWVEYTGVPMDEHLDAGWNDLLHPEDRSRALAAWRDAVEGRAAYNVEYRVRRQDGKYEWFKVTGRPIRDGSGQIVRWFGVATNIHDLKRAEEVLHESERKYRIVADHTYDWEFWLGPDGRFVYCSPSCERVTGYAAADFLADPELLHRIVHPDDRAIYAAHVGTGQGCVTEEAQFRIVHRDGSIRWIEHLCRPVYDEAGGRLGIRGNNRDITHRKRVEDALRHEHAFANAVIEAAGHGICVCHETKESPYVRFTLWNQRMTDLTGYEMEEINRLGWYQTLYADPAIRAQAQARMQRMRQGEDLRDEQWRITRKDGAERTVNISTSLVRQETGEVHVLGVLQDITEQKQAEEELAAAKISAERAKQAAEEASRAKDHFLAVLSHELRNPLTPVLPALEMLETLVPPEGVGYLEMARRNVELEARLIDDLLDVTRIAHGKVELDRQPVELCTVVERAAEVCAPDIEARRLHFGIKIDGAPHLVHADAARLQQVFWNLIKNAVKFTDPGGCVGVHGWRENGRAIVQVIDSGHGIEAEALSRVFNAFEQEGHLTTRQFGGLGLGLAISRAMVEMHGGSIRAFSEGKGRGSTFTVELPIHQVKQATEGKPQTPTVEEHLSVPLVPRSLKILMVEDHGDTARIMGQLLSIKGHTVIHAGDVSTALELAGQEAFDVLVSDLGLPDGSGHDLMRQLVARGKKLPAIAISGYGMAADVQQSYAAGFLEHLTKPVTLGSILAALNRVASIPLAPAAYKR